VIQKKKKFPSLVAQPGNGIQTPAETVDAGSGNGGGKKGAKFIVAPSQGIPTQTADAGNGNGGAKAVQFIVAPGQGLPTPAETGGKGKAKKVFPTLAKASGGFATPTEVADAGPDPLPSARTKTFPLIVSAPEGLSTPADVAVDTGTPAAADVTPAAAVAAADDGQPATDTKDAAVIASVAPAAIPTMAVANPNDLYSVLTGHGYGVQILKRDGHGNLVFYVTASATPKDADLLLVDGTYGKVIERKHVAAYGYVRPAAPYTPRYAATYAGDDNCDQTAGY